MRVAIAGGHGQIALLLTERLAAAGEEVVSLIRNPDHAGDVEAKGAEARTLDLESAGPGDFAAAIDGCDAVVFAAGAGPGSGPERKKSVDHQAAVKLLEAASTTGASRYVMVSSMAADPDHEGDDVFDVYLRAKGRADAALIESTLPHTIVRPGMLTDEPPTGRVTAGAEVPRGPISRADVAAVLAAVLADEGTAGLVFEVVAGETPISAALHAL